MTFTSSDWIHRKDSLRLFSRTVNAGVLGLIIYYWIFDLLVRGLLKGGVAVNGKVLSNAPTGFM
jgi:hypothetical protein